MSRTMLSVAADLQIGAELVTTGVAILGVRGSGKTNTAVDLAEECVAAGIPFAVIDPTGVWWGLKSSRDGKHPGLPVYVFGGEHADAPLEPGAGAVIATFLVEKRVPIVLDLKLMRKAQQVQFVTDFAETLYHLNREPLPLLLDEAARFCPQMVRPDMARCVGAIEDIVTLGRSRGLGPVLIGQRAALINKNVLTQCETIVCMRTVSPQDRKAIDEWVEAHGSKEERDRMMSELAKLPTGVGYIWSPSVLELFRKVRFRERRTFDSSRTPKVGERVFKPKAFAAVDLSALTSEIQATIERAKADDPKALRRRIAELERQLAARPAAQPERVEVPVVTDKMVECIRSVGEELQSRFDASLETLEKVVRPYAERLDSLIADAAAVVTRAPARPREARQMPRAPVVAPAGHGRAETTPRVPVEGARLEKAQRAILTVLAQYPQGRTVTQIALLAGYASNGGGFRNALSSLRTRGYVQRGEPVVITDAGLDALGAYDPLPQGEALITYWYGRLGKAERAILETLVEAYPQDLSTLEIAERCGYAASGGGFRNALSRLRTLQLIEGYGPVVASKTLCDGR